MVSDQCNFSGKNTVFFYPDCRTAIVGSFGLNGTLESGHVTEIIGVDSDLAQNPEPVFLAPDTDVSKWLALTKLPAFSTDLLLLCTTHCKFFAAIPIYVIKRRREKRNLIHP